MAKHNFSIGQTETLQRATAKEFGADQAVVDDARVLRILGFYNKKYPEPHQVTAKRLSEEIHRPEHFRMDVPEFNSESIFRTSTIKATSTATEQGKTITQSERDWAYAKRKLAMGMDPEEVIRAIAEYRLEKWRPESYARRTVEKALAEIQATGSSEETRSPVNR